MHAHTLAEYIGCNRGFSCLKETELTQALQIARGCERIDNLFTNKQTTWLNTDRPQTITVSG